MLRQSLLCKLQNQSAALIVNHLVNVVNVAPLRVLGGKYLPEYKMWGVYEKRTAYVAVLGVEKGEKK